MATFAVEFAVQGTKLHLVYRPDIRSPDSLRKHLAEGNSVTIKGTYHLSEANLFKGRVDVVEILAEVGGRHYAGPPKTKAALRFRRSLRWPEMQSERCDRFLLYNVVVALTGSSHRSSSRGSPINHE